MFELKGDRHVDGEEILKFITMDEDSYKWCNNVNKFIWNMYINIIIGYNYI